MAISFKGKSLHSLVVTKMMFAATVYGIWRERNARMFQGVGNVSFLL
jgi:hypothetical protein